MSFLSLFMLTFLVMASACSSLNHRGPSAETDTNAINATLSRSGKYDIDVTGASPVDINTLTPLLDQVVAEFEQKVSPLNGKIKISIGAKNCLRVGYSFTNGDVEFCAAKNVNQFGLVSADVIRHEVFHAMVCNVRPEICTPDVLKDNVIVASHEALADFFAYQFAPDQCFGKNFYTNQTCVRHYLTTLCYSLVNGPHEKGNALESVLISANINLPQISQAILKSDFTADALLSAVGLPVGKCFDPSAAPQISNTVSGYPASALNKYWLRPQAPLVVQFQANTVMTSVYPQLSVQWLRDDGTASTLFDLTSNGALSFSIEPKATSGIEKLTAQILSGTDVIGLMPFYFGIKTSK